MLRLLTTSIDGKYLNNAHWVENTHRRLSKFSLIFFFLFCFLSSFILFSTMYFTLFSFQRLGLTALGNGIYIGTHFTDAFHLSNHFHRVRSHIKKRKTRREESF